MVPRQIRDTVIPVLPRVLYCMVIKDSNGAADKFWVNPCSRSLLAATLMALSAIPTAAAPVRHTQVVDGGASRFVDAATGFGLIGLGLCRRRRRITMNVAGGSK
jgi:hypothetical protein